MLTPRQTLTAIRLRRAGIVNPIITVQEADRVGVPYDVLATILDMETGGGKNVFGHDPGGAVTGGKVTKERYLEYRRALTQGAGKFPQGVGPMQLTSLGLQNEADRMGGCWIPRYNIRVGARFLKESANWRSSKPYWFAAKAYNGSEAYARKFTLRREHWIAVVRGKRA